MSGPFDNVHSNKALDNTHKAAAKGDNLSFPEQVNDHIKLVKEFNEIFGPSGKKVVRFEEEFTAGEEKLIKGGDKKAQMKYDQQLKDLADKLEAKGNLPMDLMAEKVLDHRVKFDYNCGSPIPEQLDHYEDLIALEKKLGHEEKANQHQLTVGTLDYDYKVNGKLH